MVKIYSVPTGEMKNKEVMCLPVQLQMIWHSLSVHASGSLQSAYVIFLYKGQKLGEKRDYYTWLVPSIYNVKYYSSA